jgi:hypothetical protein
VGIAKPYRSRCLLGRPVDAVLVGADERSLVVLTESLVVIEVISVPIADHVRIDGCGLLYVVAGVVATFLARDR